MAQSSTLDTHTDNYLHDPFLGRQFISESWRESSIDVQACHRSILVGHLQREGVRE